ncbi:MAG TPA: hypothetical protein VEH86_04870 [Candidatus Acidoferrum sp.]|nr:hypothetical protein [Candidatus Acidoferrum sp.]
MTLTQKQKIIPLAMVTLCVIIGMMTILFVFYYANAINNQNQSHTQITNLQTQNTNLQNQLASSNSQISSLTSQVNSLTADRQSLQTQLDQLSAQITSLSSLIARMQAAQSQNTPTGGGKALRT